MRAPRARLVEIQRVRLLSAALSVLDEHGYAHATVAHVTARARVSRRTFYELFADREECLLAALESVVERLEDELAAGVPREAPWRERVRAGLWTILSFLDREPALARVVIVEALRGGPPVLERRERALARLAGALDGGRAERARGRDCPPLTAAGLVGAAFAVVYGRLLRGEREPLTSVFGELMGMIALPYLGPAAARREQERPAPVRVAVPSGPRESPAATSAGGGDRGGDALAGVPMRLTYRTARVLETIAADPGVSNRRAAQLAGVTDQGQISKLLARLERLGLVVNRGVGHARGEANAWSLTDAGERLSESFRGGGRELERGSSRTSYATRL